jgi:hypothetical protein
MNHDLWAVVSYFNPMRYARRRANFRAFRRGLNVPLLTVELSYDADFELAQDDCDQLVQIHGRDFMWQKERLLNVGLKALPPACGYVAWLDCDILFADADWSARAVQLLEQFALVQLFEGVDYMDRDWMPGSDPRGHLQRRRLSTVSGVRSGMTLEACMQHPSPRQRMGTYANGLAWAGRRDVLSRHGFYDARILGGGDRAIICAAYGQPELMIQRHELNDKQQAHYLAWAQPFWESVRGNVAHVEGDIHHLWHGDVAGRGLATRQSILRECGYDPHVDIAVQDSGCWGWCSDKPELHARVREYFAHRKEDG